MQRRSDERGPLGVLLDQEDREVTLAVCRKPLLVGELNPYGSDPRYALFPYPKNSSGDRLCRQVLGLTRVQYLRRFERANLCTAKWDLKSARECASLLLEFHRGPVVLLGAKVAKAFGVGYLPFAIAPAAGDRKVLVLPHPSGLCRAWNEGGSFEKARRAVRAAGVVL